MKSSKGEDLNSVSKLVVTLNGSILHVDYQRARKRKEDTLAIDTADAPEGRKLDAGLKVLSYKLRDTLLLNQKTPNGDSIVVFTEGDSVKYYRHTSPQVNPLSRLITVKSRAYPFLTKRGIRLFYACLIENRYRLPVRATSLVVGSDYSKKKSFPVYRTFPSKLRVIKNALFTDFIKLDPLLEGEPEINATIGVSIDIEGDGVIEHSLTKGSKRIEQKGRRWFYAPIARTRKKGFSVSIRRNGHGGLALVRRRLEDIELTPSFRFYESLLVSFLLYYTAVITRRLSKTIVNIYYEKNASQAQEGAIELFRKARDNSASKNYFVIRKSSEYYDEIKDEPGVVANFTLKSYWLMYRSNNYIATETMNAHYNVLRSSNKYAKKAPFSKKFIFLQHGVTYLKAHDKYTTFAKNKETEPDYMIVNSMKERDVTSEMLNIPEERLLNVGMPIFDTLEYEHIGNGSNDIVTVMLTWRAYEEHLQDFTKSTYYQYVYDALGALDGLISSENIRLIVHPKFQQHVKSTDISDMLWGGTIKEALRDSKLLVTDYSSVCYNVFYQGGAVIFYQPDIDFYEQMSGKLIPQDNEYIGSRVFDRLSMRELLEKGISSQKIQLSKFRTKKHESNYLTINEHHDGKNVDRIYSELEKRNIL